MSNFVDKSKEPVYSCFFKQILRCDSCFCSRTILGSSEYIGSTALFLASSTFLSAKRKDALLYRIDFNICYDRCGRFYEYLPHNEFKKGEYFGVAWSFICCRDLCLRWLFHCGTVASANIRKRRGHRDRFLCTISRVSSIDFSGDIVLVAIFHISTNHQGQREHEQRQKLTLKFVVC